MAFQKKIFYAYKRCVDLLLGSIGLIAALPFLFILGALIRIESAGPALYRQTRLGRNGVPFELVKLRSMYIQRGKSKAGWTLVNDPRITGIGRFLRKTHLDELPQLWNVIRGDMSIVGPRPEVPLLSEKFEAMYPGFKYRLAVKPGLTGWAQVNGGYEINPRAKARLDRYYIDHQGLWLDLRIMALTLRVLVTGKGAR